MCGPLAVAGCARGGSVRAGPAAGYFAGRLVSYATVGALLGHAGGEALRLLPVQAVQTAAAVAVALAAAWRGVALFASTRGRVAAGAPIEAASPRRAPTRPLLARLGAVLPKRGLALGLATGFLPCGLFVPVWLLAGASGGAPSGAAVMLVFAVATLPGLVVPLAGRRLIQRVAARLPAAVPVLAWGMLAVWIALRPLLVPAGRCH